jgi:hypothetical protein
MNAGQWLDYVPIWLLFLATVAIVRLSIEAGFRLGMRRRLVPQHEQDAPIGSTVAAVLGLLAFMLAFTFGLATARYDARKQLVLDEANAIGTTYLRAGLLPEPSRTEIRDLLREYTGVRAQSIQPETIDQAIAHSEALQDRLWSQAVAVGQANAGSIPAGLFIQSLNEVIDIHAKRITAGLRSRIPEVVWIVLYVVTILAMTTMGYQSGLAGSRGWVSVILLALMFATVLLLVVDLDRPHEGAIRVSQQALVDLWEKLGGPAH